MKFSTTTLGIATSLCLLSDNVLAFAPAHSNVFKTARHFPSSQRFAMMETEEKKEVKSTMDENEPTNAEGLPWWWEYVWKLDIMKKGEPGTDCTFGDSANVLRTNIEQIYGGYPSLDGCPLAEGDIADIADGTQFIGLQKYYRDNGSPYKLCFGPKSFLVISDPVQAKHILREEAVRYDKGLLAEILEPIMGKGLIPADPETWSVRRRQIVPAFHKAWLGHMVGLFGYCNIPLISSLDKLAAEDGHVEMEEKFCSVALDIIGKSVFNFEFNSVTKESPVVKAVYRALVEAEHRSMTPAPYWNLPFANQLVPRLRAFNADLELLNDVLDDLINRAKTTRQVEDIEELERRDYANVKDPSLLRFMVDMRGADIDNKQLRDDLMTMLIAGHETTAAVLTWALFELLRNPECMKKAQEEIDRVIGDRTPTLDDIKEMKYVRLVIAETLRLYPEPPLLIRRCRTEDKLPKGGGREATVIRGMDMFLALYNIHRDEKFWEEPDKFDPMRFTRKFVNPDIPEWEGFDPAKWEGRLYPNELASDFAYLPFGGGPRKCIGDEFATLEATVTLAMVLRRYNFEFDKSKATNVDIMDIPYLVDHPVGMRSGATIHTRNGLHLIIKKRDN
jgi:cytochrome P450 family 97 subfamily B polypeptide 3